MLTGRAKRGGAADYHVRRREQHGKGSAFRDPEDGEKRMKVLAFDTAAAACSVAVLDGGRIRAHRARAMRRGHAEALMPMIVDALAEAGLAWGDLDLVATTVGPGSFTGLRVGLAAARGIALAAGIPAFGATTLETLAAGLDEETRAGAPVAAALDARRGEIYLQLFDAAGAPASAAVAVAPGEAALPAGPLVLVGDGAQAVLAAQGPRPGWRLVDAPAAPDAVPLARLAARRFAATGRAPAPRPLYIRGHGARPPAES